MAGARGRTNPISYEEKQRALLDLRESLTTTNYDPSDAMKMVIVTQLKQLKNGITPEHRISEEYKKVIDALMSSIPRLLPDWWKILEEFDAVNRELKEKKILNPEEIEPEIKIKKEPIKISAEDFLRTRPETKEDGLTYATIALDFYNKGKSESLKRPGILSYLRLAASLSISAAKLVLTTELHTLLNAKQKIAIYYEHRTNDRFLKFILDIKPRAQLPYLLSDNTIDLIRGSGGLTLIFTLQGGNPDNLKTRYFEEGAGVHGMFGHGAGFGAGVPKNPPPKAEHKHEPEKLKLDPNFDADVNKFLDPKKIDIYEKLGVAREATDAEIRKAYKAKALAYHPDRAAADKKEEHEKIFKEIQAINDILTDPRKKAYYDKMFPPPAPSMGLGAGRR